MRTRNEQLYNLYRPSSQRSLRDREHFDNAWELQRQIPLQLTGEEFIHIDMIWINYSRSPDGGFTLCYTIFSTNGNYTMLFQHLTRLIDVDQVITYLRKNLINNN